MKTNKPGSVNQQPLYGCTSCYEECTYPADHLHVYDNECWCDLCWDERRWDFPDQPYWNDLEPYTPALQAECEELREHLQNLIDQTTPLEPVPGNPMWSRRIQLDEVIAERDSLRAECEKLRSIISDLKDWDCDVSAGFLSIPVYLRRRMQEAIDAAMQE